MLYVERSRCVFTLHVSNENGCAGRSEVNLSSTRKLFFAFFLGLHPSMWHMVQTEGYYPRCRHAQPTPLLQELEQLAVLGVGPGDKISSFIPIAPCRRWFRQCIFRPRHARRLCGPFRNGIKKKRDDTCPAGCKFCQLRLASWAY